MLVSKIRIAGMGWRRLVMDKREGEKNQTLVREKVKKCNEVTEGRVKERTNERMEVRCG